MSAARKATMPPDSERRIITTVKVAEDTAPKM